MPQQWPRPGRDSSSFGSVNNAHTKSVDISVLSATEAPHLYRSREFWEDEFRRLRLWPDLLSYDATSQRFSSLIDIHFPRFQLIAVSRLDETRVLGIAHAVPLQVGSRTDDLPETGWDWALEAALLQKAKGFVPDSLCGLSISVLPEFQRRGVGTELIRAVVMAARKSGLQQVIMPIRPITKAQYPLLPMEQFMKFLGKDGLQQDPWIRAHQECGGVIERICHRSMTVTAPVSEWNRWSGTIFNQSGSYVVKGCLAPVMIDMQRLIGVYEEPNVWVSHTH
jgi:GNAT superfamily N-acetyltransferase